LVVFLLLFFGVELPLICSAMTGFPPASFSRCSLSDLLPTKLEFPPFSLSLLLSLSLSLPRLAGGVCGAELGAELGAGPGVVCTTDEEEPREAAARHRFPPAVFASLLEPNTSSSGISSFELAPIYMQPGRMSNEGAAGREGKRELFSIKQIIYKVTHFMRFERPSPTSNILECYCI
jgi:hypothetical protein